MTQEYCAVTPKAVWNIEACKRLCAVQSDWCNAIKSDYCNVDRMAYDEDCRDWVVSQHGKHDAVMGKYCAQAPTDPLCACLVSEIDCPNKFDIKCVNTLAYKDYNMMNAVCPDVMNCIQFANLSSGAQALVTNLEQDCSTDSDSSTITVSSVTDSTDLVVVISIIFIFILTILIATLIVIYKSKKNKVSQ